MKVLYTMTMMKTCTYLEDVLQQSVIDREQDNNDNFPWLLNRDHNR